MMDKKPEPGARLLLSAEETRALLALLADAPAARKSMSRWTIVLYTLCTVLVIVPVVLDLLGIGTPCVIVDAVMPISDWLKDSFDQGNPL